MNEISFLPVKLLTPHPDNPRKELGDLSELAASIKKNGIFQNLTVVPYEDGYRVVIGHRRLAAAKLAGLAAVPCVVADMTPKEQVQTMLLENMQRSDLTVYEQAQGFQMMLDLGSTVEELAEKSGFSETTIRRRVKMMELDQKKLKEVSGRQLSLADFDTLAKIENIKERNKVLESIGTRDFDAAVNTALRSQAAKNNLPLIKAWLKEIGAKELPESEKWSASYENYPGASYYIYFYNWGKKDSGLPEKIEGEVFYYLDSNSLRLYRKRVKAQPEKKTPEELAEEKRVREAWKTLEEAAALAYELRKAFVDKLKVTSQNRARILYGAFLAGVCSETVYTTPDRAIREWLGFDKGWERDADGKTIRGLAALKDADLPALVYALFGDNEKAVCATNSRREMPHYRPKAEIHALYEWLHGLGYQSSSEEIRLLDGTHEAFERSEA